MTRFEVPFTVTDDLPLPRVYEQYMSEHYLVPRSMVFIPIVSIPNELLDQLRVSEKTLKRGYTSFRTNKRVEVVSRDPNLGYPRMVQELDILRARNLPSDELFRGRRLEVALDLKEISVPAFTGMVAFLDLVTIIEE